jgi:hypothetical protein
MLLTGAFDMDLLEGILKITKYHTGELTPQLQSWIFATPTFILQTVKYCEK